MNILPVQYLLENLLEKHSTKEFLVKELEETDYNKGYFELLSQLTVSPKLSFPEFQERFQIMKSFQSYLKTVVIEERSIQKIIATATIIIEPKFIRSLGKVGHIEDVIVHKNYQGKQLGQKVIDILKVYGFSGMNAYKIILDCAPSVKSFYERQGFKDNSVCMAIYKEGIKPKL